MLWQIDYLETLSHGRRAFKGYGNQLVEADSAQDAESKFHAFVAKDSEYADATVKVLFVTEPGILGSPKERTIEDVPDKQIIRVQVECSEHVNCASRDDLINLLTGIENGCVDGNVTFVD